MAEPVSACNVAHDDREVVFDGRTLVAVFTSPVARHLLAYGRDLGYRTVLIEPDPALPLDEWRPLADVHASAKDADLGPDTDVVVTDHHRPELGEMLRDALAIPTRWIGLMGNPRHVGPHVAALAALGVPDTDVARVHRPIGLNIGSRTPPEIAIATLAGLIADRNSRPGGLHFPLERAYSTGR
jgi:xanthine dehydrogenase accessory factor